ncbi:imelysin family protein [Dongia sp.]|uniref:imelysin family protein n=1 Tax=Dongia sp. TaxID=1977262 RepID=UPI0035B0FEA6
MTDKPSGKSFDKLTRRQTLAAMLAAGMVGTGMRSASAADFAAFNPGYAKNIVMPAFAQLAAASESLATAASAGCADPKAPDLITLQQAYHIAADAWADAQMFRLGPLADGQRAERFAYWPERRNIIDKQLSALLADDDTISLDAAKLGGSSVAVQGIPALERLLYRDEPLPPTGCAVIQAIAGNLVAIATEAQKAWQQAAAKPAPFAANPTEATTQFYTNLLTLLQIVADQKIGAPLGGDVAAAKPKSAEQWRSGRSLRNIRRNLAAAQNALFGKGGFAALLTPEQSALADNLKKAFADAIAAAEKAGDDLPADVSDESRRHLATELLVKVNHLRDLLRQDVPPVIGITLGFNELDGDGS